MSRATSLVESPSNGSRVAALFPALLMGLWIGNASTTLAADVAEPLEFESPRQVGYLLGDIIEHRLGLRVHSPWTLDEDAMPESGRVTRWLRRDEPELRSHWRPGGRHYEIVLRYQIVRSVPRVMGMATPPVALTLRNGDDLLPVVLPTWGFETSPISREIDERPEGQLPELRPVHLPPPIDQRWRQLRLLVLGGAMLALSLWLADRHGWLPRRASDARPFADALRALPRGEGEAAATARLTAAHNAFNVTAGHAVFAGNLSQFFDAHPGFAPVHEQVTAFFSASQHELFHGTAPHVSPADATTERGVRALLRACRSCERVAPGRDVGT